MQQPYSSIEITQARFDEAHRELQLTAELLNGQPAKGDGVFLKDEHGFVEYALVHHIAQNNEGQYDLRLQFPKTPYYWKHHVDQLMKLGQTKVFCGMDIDSYLDLPTNEQLDYLLSLTDFLTPERVAGFLQNQLRLACKMIPIEREAELNLSKFGGLPTLPADMPYPRDTAGQSLLFIAQIDLSEVAPHLASIKAIATEGILYLFGEIYSEEEVHQLNNIQVYYAPPEATLYEQKLPADLSEFGSFREMNMMVFDEWNVPPIESYLWTADPMNDAEERAYTYFTAILDTYNQFGGAKLLGHPDQIQGCVLMEAVLQQHKKAWYNPEGYDPEEYSAIAEALSPETQQWQLLFQLDALEDYIRHLSNLKGAFNQHMEGCYYFMIPSADLNQLRFDRGVTVYQST